MSSYFRSNTTLRWKSGDTQPQYEGGVVATKSPKQRAGKANDPDALTTDKAEAAAPDTTDITEAAEPPPPPGKALVADNGGTDDGPPPGVPLLRSSWMDYLPGIYADNDFLARFLLILEHVHSPIQRTISNIQYYFDPDLVPDDLVPWLGSWLGLVLDEGWPEDRRRELIRNAPMLYQWRGTRRGMEEVIRLYTGTVPVIEESTPAEIDADATRAFRFRILLQSTEDDVDEELLRQVIDLEKPAMCAYDLEMS